MHSQEGLELDLYIIELWTAELYSVVVNIYVCMSGSSTYLKTSEMCFYVIGMAFVATCDYILVVQ